MFGVPTNSVVQVCSTGDKYTKIIIENKKKAVERLEIWLLVLVKAKMHLQFAKFVR